MSPHSHTTAVLVHGAFGENACWRGVIAALARDGVRAFAASNGLRGLGRDAEDVADVVRHVDGPVVLVGHAYGGSVITDVAAAADNVRALVYVAAVAPDTGESTAELTERFPGSALAESVETTPRRRGGCELAIRPDRFAEVFGADLDPATAASWAATQRSISSAALDEPLATVSPGWRYRPSWFVYGTADRLLPEAALAFCAARARSRGTTAVTGASHAIHVSRPEVVARTILSAIAEGTTGPRGRTSAGDERKIHDSHR